MEPKFADTSASLDLRLIVVCQDLIRISNHNGPFGVPIAAAQATVTRTYRKTRRIEGFTNEYVGLTGRTPYIEGSSYKDDMPDTEVDLLEERNSGSYRGLLFIDLRSEKETIGFLCDEPRVVNGEEPEYEGIGRISRLGMGSIRVRGAIKGYPTEFAYVLNPNWTLKDLRTGALYRPPQIIKNVL